MIISPPRQAVFEVAAVCNLRCPQCWVGLNWIDRGSGQNLMSLETFNRACEGLRSSVKHSYLHLWGEPTINKNLFKMIDIAREFSTVDLATHGLFVTEENAPALAKASNISVSIDGITQEVYEKYRVGGKFDRAIRGLELLAKAAPGRVIWTYCVFKHNEHQIPEAIEMAKRLGVPIGLKPPLFWDKSTTDQMMPTEQKYRRYLIKDGSWELKADRLKCREFWETIYILPDGNIITCCYDGNAEFVTGNINERPILDIWNGEKYNVMRASHSAGRLNEMCLKYCHLP